METFGIVWVLSLNRKTAHTLILLLYFSHTELPIMQFTQRIFKDGFGHGFSTTTKKKKNAKQP